MALLFSYDAPTCWPEERLLAHLLRNAASGATEPFQSLGGSHPVDVYASKDAYELRADAPGVSSNDVTVEVHEGVLSITVGAAQPPAASPSARSKGAAPKSPPSPTSSAQPAAADQAAPQWKLLRRERTSGPARWARAFLLPENADADYISVHLALGVLTVRIPLCLPPPKPQPRRIPVSGDSAHTPEVARPSSPAAASPLQRPASPAGSGGQS